MNRPTPPKRTRSRGGGRPSGDDRDLRETLLDTAIERFVKVGIGATSLRSIAVAAGVTPAMLHYYFGDKQRLIRAMIDERLMPALGQMQVRLKVGGDDPVTLIEGFVRGLGDVMRSHPWLPSLWVREVLCEGGALREVVLSEVAPRIPVVLAQRLASAQAAGRLSADLDPRLLVMSLVGLTLFPAAGAPVWQRMFNIDDLNVDVMIEHALAMIVPRVRVDAGGTS